MGFELFVSLVHNGNLLELDDNLREKLKYGEKRTVLKVKVSFVK